MAYIAAMQGRLLPPEPGKFQAFPRERWRDEFALAASAGFDGIEWLFDVYGEDVNPLSTDEGLNELRNLSSETGVAVRSVCADYFMHRPFLRATPSEQRERMRKMEWLLSRCRAAGIRRIVLPMLDNSAIHNDEEKLQVIAVLRYLLPALQNTHIEIDIETSLEPESIVGLFEQCQHPLVRINYDSGNSASRGYKVHKEFAAYGQKIGSVHVKDRPLGGSTVPLGTGDADLSAFFSALAKLKYSGDYVLEIARPEPGRDEVPWMAHYREWVAAQIQNANEAAQ